MVKVDDWILRYAFLMGKRYTDRERVKSLRSMTREFIQMGYTCDTTKVSLALMGTKKRFYNLYAGDLKQAKIILATYYDTPVKTFGLYKERAFQRYISRFAAFINLLPAFIIFCFAFTLIYFGFFPLMGRSNLVMIASIITALLALFFIARYRAGVPRRSNMVRNTSSVLAILELADLLKGSHDEVAFALVDGGSNSDYGLKMAKDYFNKGNKKFIVLDSIGNTGDLLCFTDQKLEMDDELRVRRIPSSWESIGDFLLTAGKLEKTGIILKRNKAVDIESIKKAVDKVQRIVNSLQ